ncbi:hypothetical protein [Granulicella tundricola]|uniref:hypothetical protein n=1 Tax=Granulicella tundricola TaxID=940615 RepID=UPI0001DB8124|nr:hypothetical protein [Granulicella tundricola]
MPETSVQLGPTEDLLDEFAFTPADGEDRIVALSLGQCVGSRQTYNGQRPTWKTSTYLLTSWDMRQLGIKGGHFYAIGAIHKIRWTVCDPNRRIDLLQSLFTGKLEVKSGYIDNDFEFIGTAIGGQASSGSLGGASLPFEVAMSTCR